MQIVSDSNARLFFSINMQVLSHLVEIQQSFHPLSQKICFATIYIFQYSWSINRYPPFILHFLLNHICLFITFTWSPHELKIINTCSFLNLYENALLFFGYYLWTVCSFMFYPTNICWVTTLWPVLVKEVIRALSTGQHYYESSFLPHRPPSPSTQQILSKWVLN